MWLIHTNTTDDEQIKITIFPIHVAQCYIYLFAIITYFKILLDFWYYSTLILCLWCYSSFCWFPEVQLGIITNSRIMMIYGPFYMGSSLALSLGPQTTKSLRWPGYSQLYYDCHVIVLNKCSLTKIGKYTVWNCVNIILAVCQYIQSSFGLNILYGK